MKILAVLIVTCSCSFIWGQQTKSVHFATTNISGLDTMGVHFEHELSWDQVKEKAKSTNKYIFLDCIATWCGPCKAMDKNVYTNPAISRLLNDQFISVKVQMDKTTYDVEAVKRWYFYANLIQRNYSVSAFPTFLFFSPDGVPVHKAVGYKNPGEFLNIVKDVFDPNKQYYRILRDFQPGAMDTLEEKGLAHSFYYTDKSLGATIAVDYLKRIPFARLKEKENKELLIMYAQAPQIKELAIRYVTQLDSNGLIDNQNRPLIRSYSKNPEIRKVAFNYFMNLDHKAMSSKCNLDFASIFNDDAGVRKLADEYIRKLSEKEKFNRDNIQFISNFTRTSKDPGFELFYRHADKINAIVKSKKVSGVYQAPDYAERLVLNIIGFEEINPYYDSAVQNGSDDSINWKEIEKNIREKYNATYAERAVLTAKVSLYRDFANKNKKYWLPYIGSNIELIKKYEMDTTSTYVDATMLNGLAWDVFVHSNDKKQLLFAINLMQGVIRRNPNHDGELDTYANLLYKIGRQEDAIQIETKALEIAAAKGDKENTEIFEQTLNKMKKGEPTWN